MPSIDFDPANDGGFLLIADAVRDYAFTRGHDSRDEEIAGLENTLLLAQEQVDRLTSEVETLAAERDNVQAAFDAYKASHPDTDPPPPPPPDPEPTDHVLAGMSAPKELWPTRVRELGDEAELLQARRLFWESPTDADVTKLTNEAVNAHLVPHGSYKVNNDWKGTAAGKYDAAFQSAARFFGGLDTRVDLAFHHEPGKQSLGPTKGEGGTPADYAAMYLHLIPIFRAAAPKVRIWPVVNGWWFSGQARGWSDAEIAPWLTDQLLAEVDGVAADHYSGSATEGESVTARVARHIAWAKRHGVEAVGIWETNAFTADALNGVFDLAKREPLFAKGAAMVWNSTTETYKPLVETGLLDEFQSILRDWPR